VQRPSGLAGEKVKGRCTGTLFIKNPLIYQILCYIYTINRAFMTAVNKRKSVNLEVGPFFIHQAEPDPAKEIPALF